MEIPRVRLKLHGEGRELQVGDVLSMPPCLSPPALANFREERRRPCPRVELDPSNAAACSLFTMLAQSHTRVLALPLFEAEADLREWPREKRLRILHRATQAMLDPVIVKAMRPESPR